VNSKNVLIIGANSFSGSAFANDLQKSYVRHLVFRNELPSSVFNPNDQRREHETSTRWNLNDDCRKILELINENEVGTVVNFAAQSMVGQSWENPADWYEANVVSLSKLVSSISQHCKIESFIQFSTPEVYGSTSGWVKENFNFAPNSPYAVSRAASDWHLKALFENKDFPVIFTRAANVYGEHQRLYRIIPKLVLSGLTGKRVALQGGGKSIRSFIHIDDVNNALIKVMENGKLGETYHISTKELVSIYDLAVLVARKMNTQIEDLIEEVPDRVGKDFAYQLDSEKIRLELGWCDQVSLDRGLDRTIAWVSKNLPELSAMSTDYTHRK
jgi:dTDP-glucose 4,6-dehydratase